MKVCAIVLDREREVLQFLSRSISGSPFPPLLTFFLFLDFSGRAMLLASTLCRRVSLLRDSAGLLCNLVRSRRRKLGKFNYASASFFVANDYNSSENVILLFGIRGHDESDIPHRSCLPETIPLSKLLLNGISTS